MFFGERKGTPFTRAFDIGRHKKEKELEEAQKKQQAEQSGLTRRQLLEKGMKYGLAAAVAGLVGKTHLEALLKPAHHDEEPKDEESPKDAVAHTEASAEKTDEKESLHIDTLNVLTALPVTSTFFYYVKRGMDGPGFGMDTILTLNGLEAGRLQALRSFGGDDGQKIAHHEAIANMKAAAMIPALMALSHYTTTSISVDIGTVFAPKKTEQPENTVETPRLPRPEFSAPVEAWEQYLEQLNRTLTTKVAELHALSSVLAPLMTTYESSSATNQGKGPSAERVEQLKKNVSEIVIRNEDGTVNEQQTQEAREQLRKRQDNILELLYEQSLARGAVDQKKTVDAQGQEIGPEQIEAMKENARTRANELFNGPEGFTNLETTLAANIHGCIAWGDPPQLFALQKHWGKWKRILKGEAFGLLNDAFCTYTLTQKWLENAGVVSDQSLLKEFGGAYSKMGGLTEGMKFGKNKKSLNDFAEEAQKAGMAGAEKIAAVVEKLQQPVQQYLFRKGQLFEALDNLLSPEDARMVVASADAGAASYQEQQDPLAQLESFFKGNSDSFISTEQEPQAPSESLQRMIEEIMQGIEADAEKTAKEFEQQTDQPADGIQRETAQQFQSELQEAAASVETGAPADKKTIEQVIARLDLRSDPDIQAAGSHEEMQQQVQKKLEALASTDPQQFAQLFESEAKLEEQHAEHHGGLSHAAKEVRDALASQLPVVDPLASIAGIGLAKAFRLDSGEKKSSPLMVVGAAFAAFETEKRISSLADNVAAYLYAEGLLTNILERVYGKSVLEEFPDAADMVYATALKFAEQAGALTKLGNGPNFTQERFELRKPEPSLGEDPSREYVVDVKPVPFELFKNSYANRANRIMHGVCIAWFTHEVYKIERALEAKKKVQESQQKNAA